MALSIDPATKVVTIPQADLTFVTGTLYEMDTNQFRLDLEALMDNEAYIWMPHPIDHNTQYSVAGITYFRKIEMINGYSIEFSPDSQWSVRFVGSNNNLFDVENGILVQNQVQVIPSNSAGGQIIETGVSGLTPTESTQLTEIYQDQGLDSTNPKTYTPTTETVGGITKGITGDGKTTTTITRQP